jgi:hypothetical protein
MNVGIISYNIGHKKTWDVALRLKMFGHKVTIYGFPFIKKKIIEINSKEFKDRPYQILPYDPDNLYKKYEISYLKVDSWEDRNAYFLDLSPFGPQDVYVTCIAKIIPKIFLQGRVILNAHPGLLPQNRGVDSFKWAVVNRWPLGVTLHQIDEDIDSGYILHRERVPIHCGDSLIDVANRAYQVECDLLGNFDRWISNLGNKWAVDKNKYRLSREKIGSENEKNLISIFENYKKTFINNAVDCKIHHHECESVQKNNLNLKKL